jgi:hypothetical protein
MNDLEGRLHAVNPVRAQDVADAADSAAAVALLHRILDQPAAGPPRHRSIRHRAWALTGVTAAAAAAALVAVVLQGPSAPHATANHHPAAHASASGDPAPDMHLVDFTVRHGDIIARITNPDAGASQLTAVFRAHGLNISVRTTPASPSVVGTIVFSDVPQIRTLWSHSCAPQQCPVGLVIPANFTGSGSITVGRAARPGERYMSEGDVFAPGEVLHCSVLVGQPASAALPVLRRLGLHATWYALTNHGTESHIERTPAGYIVGGLAISATQVYISTQPTPPHDRHFRTVIEAEDNYGCR